MSVSAIFALLVKLATVAPQLWPLALAAISAVQDLVFAAQEAFGEAVDEPAVPRDLGDEGPAIEKAIAEILKTMPTSRGDGQFLLRLAGFLQKHPVAAQALGSLLGGLLAGK